MINNKQFPKPTYTFLLMLVFSFNAIGSTSDTIYLTINNRRLIDTIWESKTPVPKFIHLQYNANGSIRISQTFNNKKLDGKWNSYYADGTKSVEKIYQNGLLLKNTAWTIAGAITLIENYKIIKKDSVYRSVLDGLVEHYFNNGSKMTTGNYKEGEKNGLFEEYFENGIKKKTETYSNGQLNGHSAYYNNAGKLAWEANFKAVLKNKRWQNVKDGKYVNYFNSGIKSEEGVYKDGLKVGTFKTWYENGKQKNEIEFLDDQIHGQNKSWFLNGNLESENNSVMVFDSIRKYNTYQYNGTYNTYYESGLPRRISFYKNGKLDGKYAEYYDNNQLMYTIQYVNGFKKGTQINYFKNGKIFTKEKFVIHILPNKSTINVSDSLYERYIESGVKVEERWYDKGKKTGTWKSWFENGVLASESNYQKGQMSGKHLVYNKSGVLMEENYYRIWFTKDTIWKFTNHHFEVQNTIDSIHSAIDSFQRRFNATGILIREGYYKNGKIITSEKQFNNDGSLKEEKFSSGRVLTYGSNANLLSESFEINRRPVARVFNFYSNGALKGFTDYDVTGATNGYIVTYAVDGFSTNIKFNQKVTTSSADKKYVQQIWDSFANRPLPTGLIVNGKKEGAWTYWYDRTNKQLVETYKNGILNGPIKVFYANGMPLLDAQMKDGYYEGNYKQWYANGNLKAEGYYIENEPSGCWKNYLQNGNLYDAYCIKKGERPYVTYESYYESGKIKYENRYLHGQTFGIQKSYFENGKLQGQGYNENGMPEGLSYYYFENGRKKQANTYHIINGKQGVRDGGDTTWYDNGQLNMITNYRQGKRVGYTVRYAEKGNMLMSGYYKNDERDSVWVTYNDNKSIKSTSNYVNGMQQLPLSDIPCQCYDSTKVKLGFAPLLTSLAEWETVKQWSYNFHAPIDSFYEHLFYTNLQTDNNRDASFYSFRLIAFKPIYLKVPNETGLKLIFNPCRNLFNGESFIDFYVSLQTDDKSATRATLEAKKINLEFNSSVLHLWNSKKQTAFRNDNNEYLTSPILLGTSSVSYNAEEQLKIEKIKDVCFPLSEIMQSGILVSMNQLEIDLNTVKNEYAYQSFRDQRELANNPNKSARGEGSYERGYFIGIYSKDATLTLPRQLFNDQEFPLTIKPDLLAISNEEVTGKFRLKVKPLTGEEYLYEGAKDKLKLSPEILKNTFTKLGFRHVAVEFDVQSSELIVYF